MSQTPRPEYPRPNLVRENWINLNGSWRYREDIADTGLNDAWFSRPFPEPARTVIVPYPVESTASGIADTTPPSIIWYQREFEVPASWQDRVRLHFGAVDHWSRVFVNGQEVGQHRGGYSPFGFDIQHVLKPGTNTLTVRVEDSLSWMQPRGKQAGTTRWPIDYDSVTGIWQTVWLEPLPGTSIEACWSQFTLEDSSLLVSTSFSRMVEGQLSLQLLRDGLLVDQTEVETQSRSEVRARFIIDNPVLWSPDNPELYDLRLTLSDTESGGTDTASSYLGLREISVQEGKLLLNNEPLYLRGVLDQGYFPDGWYTALTDDVIRRDVELTLAMGLNCARKHQKAEDPRYLYWADRLGLLVWSEMPSGRIFSTELIETLSSEWLALIRRDRNHPSVICWVPFNESWGVWHQSIRPEQRAFVDSMVMLTRSLDQSRPVVGNDGWEFSSGDLWTLHLYQSDQGITDRLHRLMEDPGEAVVPGEVPNRRAGALPNADVTGLPILLTECGGVGFGQYGESDFSYGELPQSEAELTSAVQHIAGIIAADDTLQGFVWTQLTDIQQEINGLLYFDRSPKLPIEVLRGIFGRIGKQHD